MSAIWALHGNVGSPRDWDGMRQHLPSALEFHAVNLWETLRNGPRHLEAWGEEFSREVGDGTSSRPILLGYSLGGRLGLHALAAAPSLWRAAILVSTHPGLGDAGERRARRESDLRWAAAVREGEWPDFLERWNAQGVLAGGPVSPHQISLETSREAIATAFDCWSLGRQEHLGGHLAAFHGPVLWITGERDGTYGALASEMSRVLPDSRQVILEAGGHRLPLEQPEALARAIGAFVARLAPDQKDRA